MNRLKLIWFFCGEFSKVANSGEEIFDIKYMNTKNYPIYRDTNLTQWFQLYGKSPILKQLDAFQERDSGWALVRIIHLAVNANKFNLLNSGSYIDLPKSLKNKKALINVKNNDNSCFAWAITSALYPAEKDSDRMSSYPHYSTVLKLRGLVFPMTIKQVSHFEALNELSVNIYILRKHKRNYKVLPTYLAKQKRDKHVNLLMIQNIYYCDEYEKCLESDDCEAENMPITHHFVWIKNISRLLSSQLSKRKEKNSY